jgi:precorrin-3B methylase
MGAMSGRLDVIGIGPGDAALVGDEATLRDALARLRA